MGEKECEVVTFAKQANNYYFGEEEKCLKTDGTRGRRVSRMGFASFKRMLIALQRRARA